MTDLARAVSDLALAGTLLSLAVACGWLALRSSPLAPLLVMVTVPVQRAVEFDIGPGSLTATQMALAGFFAGCALSLAHGDMRIRLDAVTATGTALVLIYLSTVLVADDLGAWAGECYRWTSAIAFLVLSRWHLAGVSRRWIVAALGSLAVLAFAWAVVQVLLETGPASFDRNGLMRAYGGFGEPNPFGAFAVAVSLPLVAATLLGSSLSRGVRMAATAASAAGIGMVVLTQSRGAALGLALGVAIIGVAWLVDCMPAIKPVLVPAACAVAGVIASVLAIGQPWSPGDRDITSANWAERERAAHWSAAITMVEADPILGVGAGLYSKEYRDATTNWHFRISRGHAHNAYLQVASEAGVFALLAYSAFLGAILASLWRRIGFDSCDWLGWGVLAVTAALMAHQIFDYLHVLSLGIVYAGLWAAAMPAVRTRTHDLEHRGRT